MGSGGLAVDAIMAIGGRGAPGTIFSCVVLSCFCKQIYMGSKKRKSVGGLEEGLGLFEDAAGLRG